MKHIRLNSEKCAILRIFYTVFPNKMQLDKYVSKINVFNDFFQKIDCLLACEVKKNIFQKTLILDFSLLGISCNHLYVYTSSIF